MWFGGDSDRMPEVRFYRGVIGPAVLLFLGVTAIYSQQMQWGRRLHRTELSGADAVLFGAAIVCAAIGLHFHYIWSEEEKTASFAQIVVLLSLIGVIISVFWFVSRNFLNFF